MKIKYLIPVILLFATFSCQSTQEKIIGEWIHEIDGDTSKVVFSKNKVVISVNDAWHNQQVNEYTWNIISDTLTITELKGEK
jgi:hypothetical protein